MMDESKQSLKRTDDEVVGVPSEVISSDLAKLPKNILRRVRALKKLQLEEIGVLSRYYKDVHELEMKFEPELQGIRNKASNFLFQSNHH